MAEEPNLASRRLLAITEEELSRIVLDVHDGPVQYLFASLSLLAQVQRQMAALGPACDESLPTLNRAVSLVEESLHEIKSFLGAFRPPEFHRRSLEAIVEGVVIQHEEWTGSTVHLEFGSKVVDVILPAKIALYRILQEALSNAYRHAEVTEQWVKLTCDQQHIILQIIDNGRGFEPPPLHGPQATEREEHIGLRGMRDRVSLLGGTFRLVSHPGKGTTITVKVPIRDVISRPVPGREEGDLWANRYE